MADQQKEWIGITVNECLFQGIVTGDPQIVDGQNGKCAFINLKTIVSELAANGQWIDTTVLVPIVVMDQRKVDTVQKWVKDRRQLFVRTYYKAWKDDDGATRHGLMLTQMKLGSKGKPKEENTNVPSLPV